MRGRYFRYLFENQAGGLFHSGSVHDRERNTTTNYIYMVESYSRNERVKGALDFWAKEDAIPDEIDLLVLGGYTINYIRKLVTLVKEHTVRTLILPYLAPIQRLVLVEETTGRKENMKDVIRFLQDPYLFLQECGITNLYFVYGNGRIPDREPEEIAEGCYFEKADEKSLKLIWEMEGYAIPVVRAGYIIENGWFFYFGVYGLDIQTLSGFTREYFSQMENIHEVSENMKEDYKNQMKRFMMTYQLKFGNSPATTIVMYEGPQNIVPSENESFMTEKEFLREEQCRAWIQYAEDNFKTCTIRCMHEKDHDIMQHHKSSMDLRFGLLMLGNVNLNHYYEKIAERFAKIRERIRGIAVPNSGSHADWNPEILHLSEGKDRMYWICGKHEITSQKVVSDIVLSSSNNRFLTVDDERGCCLAGYLVPKEDMDRS